MVAEAAGEPLDVAVARVRAALDCRSGDGEWRVATAGPAGWVVLERDDQRVATFVTTVSGANGKLAVAILSGGRA
jgi:hypothetical protein